MTKLFLTCIALISIGLSNAQVMENTIEVRGTTTYERQIDSYIADITVSRDLVYDYYNDKPSLDEIKKALFDKMAAVGLDKNKFVEDKVAYSKLGYQGEGTVYKFETSSEDEFSKIQELYTVRGVNYNKMNVTYKDEENNESLLREAFDNAKKKAQLLASLMNKNLGDAIHINDYNLDSVAPYPDSYYYDTQKKSSYTIAVIFSVQ